MSHKDIPLNERIIFALDVDNAEEAKAWVLALESRIGFFKVGLELFLAAGFPMIDWIIGRGHKVMADLKFFDVPETVRKAVLQLAGRGISYATVHGNDPILKAAVSAKGDLKVLAVTVLTSFGEEDMRAMRFSGTIEELVFSRAKRALELGCDGVVSSGLEAARLRESLGPRLLLVTPGIRPGANLVDEADDQKRVATAYAAIRNGADQVVVGRPLRAAPDPLALAEAMQQEIAQALGEEVG